MVFQLAWSLDFFFFFFFRSFGNVERSTPRYGKNILKTFFSFHLFPSEQAIRKE